MRSVRRTPPEPPADLQVLHDEDTFVMSFELRGQEGRSKLTTAELDVIAYLLTGCSNSEIAGRRGTSPLTVANQVASILKKLALQSRLEVIAFAPLSR
jgi:DNA-binding NarL/FixJ family response regulator